MPSSIGDAYESGHVDFEITNIVYEDDSDNLTNRQQQRLEELQENVNTVPGVEITEDEAQLEALSESINTITFSYKRPAISVDSAGRFATHEIIGGGTVRQKIGEEPMEVSINGVCIEETARDLDGLRNAKYGTIKSKRLNGGFLDCHFASVSTSPLQDGGAVSFFGKDDGKAESGDFLYTFNLECVEVVIG